MESLMKKTIPKRVPKKVKPMTTRRMTDGA